MPLFKGREALGKFDASLLLQSPKMASSSIVLDLCSQKGGKESRQRKDNAGKNIVLSFQVQAIHLIDKSQMCVCVYT